MMRSREDIWEIILASDDSEELLLHLGEILLDIRDILVEMNQHIASISFDTDVLERRTADKLQ